MAKELIFMGKTQDKVRLALFDDSDGTARRLPFKELDIETFVAGIKNNSLPVRGFSSRRGRISCAFGDWYKLPNVEQHACLSLFGLTYPITAELTEDELVELAEFDGGCEVNPPWFGIASVDWETGMFRILAPSTYRLLGRLGKHKFYTYKGEFTKTRISPSDFSDSLADYRFVECDSTETLSEIADWIGCKSDFGGAYLQWLYERSENFACKNTLDERGKPVVKRPFEAWFEKGIGNQVPEIFLLGKRPLSYVELVKNIQYFGVFKSRCLDTVCVKDYFIKLWCPDNITVLCEDVRDLFFQKSTRAKLVRNDKPFVFEVRNWNGFEGSEGDYRDIPITLLRKCFTENTDDKLLFGSLCAEVSGSFQDIVADVVFEGCLRELNESFHQFSGSITCNRVNHLGNSFNSVILTAPLDLTTVTRIISSVNDVQGTILLPESFRYIHGKVFQDTNITQVKFLPDEGKKPNVTIMNPQLEVHVCCETDDSSVSFSDTDIYRLAYVTNNGLAPKFCRMNIPLNQPILGLNSLGFEQFANLKVTTLDFSLFPNVSVLPERVACRGEFTSIIIGDHIKEVADNAFVECYCVRSVYIDKSVTTLGKFLRFPRAPYVIYTQKGSVADEFASKNKIKVEYVDNPTVYLDKINQIPEDLESGLVLAVLSGKDASEGDIYALTQACEPVSIATDLELRLPIVEKIAYDSATVEVVSDIVFLEALFKPRLYAVIAHISNNADCDKDLLYIKPADLVKIHNDRFKSGRYTAVRYVLSSESKSQIALWYILKDDIVINTFTEVIAAKQENYCDFASLFNQADKIDTTETEATNIGTMLGYLGFTSDSFQSVRVNMRGQSVKSDLSESVFSAITKTHTALGVYKNKSGSRALITLNMVTLNYEAFMLIRGVVLRSYSWRFSHDTWDVVKYAMSNAMPIDSLADWTLMYSVVGGNKDVIDTVVRGIGIVCDSYSYTLPVQEIDCYRLILRAFEPDCCITESQLKDALNACKLVKHQVKFTKRDDRIKTYSQRYKSLCCLDNTACDVYQTYSNKVSWMTFSDKSIYIFPFGYIDKVLTRLVEIYDGLTFEFGAGAREDHYAHVNSRLPHEEFYIVRRFSSGGYWSQKGNFENIVAISKISGKVTFGASVSGEVIPVFWFNSCADAFEASVLCGMLPYHFKTDWAGDITLCSSLYASTDDNTGHPTYEYFPETFKETRKLLRRGARAGVSCVKGIQKLFDLAIKHPPASDFSDTE